MAHLKAVATHGKSQDRLHWKKTLIRKMYEKGHGEQEILNLFRFIDWIIKLPEGLETEIQAVVDEYEEAKQMRYVTSIERLAEKRGREEGREEAIRENIARILQLRFGLDTDILNHLSKDLTLIEDEEELKQLLDHALEAATLVDCQTHLKMPA